MSLLGGVFYRLGGSGGASRLWRLLGVPFLVTLALWGIYGGLKGWWWLYPISFGLLVASLTTYWDWMFNNIDTFWFHGLMCGAATLPFAIVSGHWLGFGLRCAALALFMGLWCKFFKNVFVEEIGRGASVVLSVPLLYL
jgi:hypothetical protein